MHALVVHISMYGWHICFYPSIIAASARRCKLLCGKSRSNKHEQSRKGESRATEHIRNQLRNKVTLFSLGYR